MNWWGICVVFIFLPAMALLFFLGIGRDDDQPRPGDIPDEVTRWREHPYSILEETPPELYDWQTDNQE